MGQRIVIIAVLVAIVALVMIFHGHGGGAIPGGDPCVSGNSPQVCEKQREIDSEHEVSNVAAARAEEREDEARAR